MEHKFRDLATESGSPVHTSMKIGGGRGGENGGYRQQELAVRRPGTAGRGQGDGAWNRITTAHGVGREGRGARGLGIKITTAQLTGRKKKERQIRREKYGGGARWRETTLNAAPSLKSIL